MEQLEELQTLWQKQRLLIGDMARYQDRQLRINAAKTIAVAVLLIPFCWILARYLRSPLVVCGILWMVASVIAFMLAYWKRQFRVSSLDFAAPSREFIAAAVARLKQQHRLFGVPFLVFVLCMIAGLNLTLLGLSTRLAAHVIYSAEVLLFCWVGLRIRERRFRRESQPLIDQLAVMEDDLATR
ncbi:MAG: hypothetical protein ABSE56_21745 [Bryobacteraceae bacterium]|jgi:MFS superfamily sulfate permease-like transporter